MHGIPCGSSRTSRVCVRPLYVDDGERSKMEMPDLRRAPALCPLVQGCDLCKTGLCPSMAARGAVILTNVSPVTSSSRFLRSITGAGALLGLLIYLVLDFLA